MFLKIGLLKCTFHSGICMSSLVLFMLGLDLAVYLFDLLILVAIFVLTLASSLHICSFSVTFAFSGGKTYGMSIRLLFLMQHNRFLF